jgi:rare lipoprotein A (peptidoglycan hydrolase)
MHGQLAVDLRSDLPTYSVKLSDGNVKLGGCAGTPQRNSNSFCSGTVSFGDGVKRLGRATQLGVVAAVTAALLPAPRPAKAVGQHRHTPEHITGPATPDLSARKRLGKASYYAQQFFGKTMADGAPMNPRGNNAASRTLPLGTVAKVTDVDTGKSAVVRIEDRGPYIKGRIVDLSPSTARKVGITPHIGVAKVVVAPIAVPLPDGRIKLAPGAHAPKVRGTRLAESASQSPAAARDRFR